MANRSAMRTEIPPPGPTLAFFEWSRLLVLQLRRLIPEVAATARGTDRATLRHGASTVELRDDAGTFTVRLCGDGSTTAVTLLCDAQRHDWFTAANYARTIAGHFDALFSVAGHDRGGPLGKN